MVGYILRRRTVRVLSAFRSKYHGGLYFEETYGSGVVGVVRSKWGGGGMDL